MERSFVSSEREHWQGNGNWKVDSDLTAFDLVLELSGCGARFGEDGTPITPFIPVDQIDALLQGVDVKADQDWAEDFFLVASHVSFDLVNDCGAHEVAFGVLWVNEITAIQKNLSTFLRSGFNDAYDSVLEL